MIRFWVARSISGAFYPPFNLSSIIGGYSSVIPMFKFFTLKKDFMGHWMGSFSSSHQPFRLHTGLNFNNANKIVPYENLRHWNRNGFLFPLVDSKTKNCYLIPKCSRSLWKSVHTTGLYKKLGFFSTDFNLKVYADFFSYTFPWYITQQIIYRRCHFTFMLIHCSVTPIPILYLAMS